MKTAFLVLTLSLMSITSFASDLTCFGKLDEEVIKQMTKIKPLMCL